MEDVIQVESAVCVLSLSRLADEADEADVGCGYPRSLPSTKLLRWCRPVDGSETLADVVDDRWACDDELARATVILTCCL